MLPLNRQQYSAAFKWQAILYAELGSNAESEWKFEVSDRLPKTYEEKQRPFLRYMSDLKAKQSFLLGQIGNADQTPIWFDIPSKRTMSKQEDRRVRLLTTGNMHNCFIVMLCCRADSVFPHAASKYHQHPFRRQAAAEAHAVAVTMTAASFFQAS
ncbi:hypothetical protein HPB51_010178 [Rhipicephalus microplus]|uniref:Uncharacterized protein n=1 Tax=Rhipicephalus microplus TaxID=6941 RepID=A0A9J6F0W2_RHIMP|nr:hypothetical protein HPB51_010178 [Rhipicephalus microplus]